MHRRDRRRRLLRRCVRRADRWPATTPFAAARYANAAAALATTGFGAVAPLPRDADVRATPRDRALTRERRTCRRARRHATQSRNRWQLPAQRIESCAGVRPGARAERSGGQLSVAEGDARLDRQGGASSRGRRVEGRAPAGAEGRVVAGLLGARHRASHRGRSRQREVLVPSRAPRRCRMATRRGAEIAALKATVARGGTQ